jgi:predicted Zn-dependent peptidase
MLFKGASRRPTAREVSEAIESVGGAHNAATDRELTIYFAKVPDSAAYETIDILADMVRDPIMDEAELEKERNVIYEELASVEDNPGELCGILCDETLWPGQPIGRAIGGTPATVEALPAAAVNRYLRAQYVPSNLVLAVAGNITHERVVESTQRWLGDWAGPDPGPWFAATARNGEPRIAVRDKDTEQAHLCLAFPGAALKDPDRYAIDLVSALLGEGMSSRLFLELREERALVYDVHTFPSEFRDTGSFTVYAGCDPENARVTIEVALEEIEKLARTLDDTELQKARNMAKGRIQLRMEDTRSVAGWIGAQELLLDEVLTVDEVVSRIDAVTHDDVLRACRRVLDPSQAVLVAVGPLGGVASFEGLI